MPSIAGQSLLVIGGSSGIGFAVAKLAIADGARVSIASSNPIRVADAVTRLKSFSPGAQVAGYQIDLRQDDTEARLEKLFAEVVLASDDSHKLDHIVFTAGDALVGRP